MSLATESCTRRSPPAWHAPHGERPQSRTIGAITQTGSPILEPTLEAIVCSNCLSKVVIDGGSIFNIMYVKTFDALGIARSASHLSVASIHDITPGHAVHSLGQIILLFMFCSSK
jgi:hypothetical protein